MEKSDLELRIEDFSSEVSKTENPGLIGKWDRIKEIIDSNTPPYQLKGIQLPIINLVTFEITDLPEELDPLGLIKTGNGGGLRDYSSTLFNELYRQGVNVHLTIPLFEQIFRKNSSLNPSEFKDGVDGLHNNNRIHLVEDGLFSEASRVYEDEKSYGLPRMDIRRAIHFQKGAIQRVHTQLRRDYSDLKVLNHCNEWSTAIIPCALKNKENTYSLMTFHNIITNERPLQRLNKHGLNTHLYWKELFYTSGFPEGDHLSNFGNCVDFLASGLSTAHAISTVSNAFLHEIINREIDLSNVKGHIPEIIKRRFDENKASGILNVPPTQSNPEFDPYLSRNFSTDDLMEGKKENKVRYFQPEMGLNINPDAPIIYWPNRLVDPQKGAKVFIELIPYLLDFYKDIGLQIAIVADGQEELINTIQKYQKRPEFTGRLSHKYFNSGLSQRGKAGSDLLVMPSLYEPSGIPQLEANGMLTIARKTGGLSNSVFELSEDGQFGNGFLFNNLNKEGLWSATVRAIDFYKKPLEFKENVLKRVREEKLSQFSNEIFAKKYISLYQEIVGKQIV